jgi:signal peptidase I
MFTPRYIKHSKLLLRHAHKYLRYKHDLLSTDGREEIVSAMRRVREALRQRDHDRIKSESATLDGIMHRVMPVTWESHWRENVEVIFVAIVVAVGIRSYFLQPFKIPTGSMQPTLNGIVGHPRVERAPNILQQAFEYVVLGRNYIDVMSAVEDEVMQIQQQKYFYFFTFSRLICRHQAFVIYVPPDTLRHDFNVVIGRKYQPGEVIARGTVDTGDQVFVDKCSYNFVKPRRGDVFVFRTRNIFGIGDQTQFYIKRLAGLAGDELRIDPPLLYVNGKPAEGEAAARVMEAKPPYAGYALGPPPILPTPQSTYVVPPESYFALGDNSYNSSDSRYWGPVPEENLVGRGLLVYWPFNHHWGLIR